MSSAGLASAVSKALTLPQATESSVVNATSLAKHLNDTTRAVATLQKQVSIAFTPNLLNQKLTSGTTSYLAHGLGRAYTGYICTRTTAGNGGAGGGVLIEESLKAGQDNVHFIALQPTVTGIYDILVF